MMIEEEGRKNSFLRMMAVPSSLEMLFFFFFLGY
jgi:hypothetical protein